MVLLEGVYELPHAMPAEGHQVVHAVVRLRDAAKHVGYALSLLRLCDRFKPEMGWAIGGITWGCISGGSSRDEWS